MALAIDRCRRRVTGSVQAMQKIVDKAAETRIQSKMNAVKGLKQYIYRLTPAAEHSQSTPVRPGGGAARANERGGRCSDRRVFRLGTGVDGFVSRSANGLLAIPSSPCAEQLMPAGSPCYATALAQRPARCRRSPAPGSRGCRRCA